MLTDLLNDPRCKLTTLRLLNSAAAIDICDSLTKLLGINPLLLKELDLSGKIQQDLQIKKLSDLVKDSHCRTQKLRLIKSSITEEGCASLLSALCLNPSHLKELDLSDNKLGNTGVKKICHLLKKTQCKLQKLILSFCCITEEGYADLASALKSEFSPYLIELDLRGNDPGETGVKKLTDLLEAPNCKLKKLRLLNSPTAVKVCDSLTKALGINPLLLKELDLSGKIQGDVEMKRISDLLVDSHCRIQKLKLSKSSVTEEDCALLSSTLCSNTSHLIELDLSENNLGISAVKQICSLLSNQCCKLKNLGLSFCHITEEGYVALASALKSNPSSRLVELDLRGNDPGDAGMEELIKVFVNPHKKLRLLNSDDAEEACNRLNVILNKNPLLLKDLDLSKNKTTDIEVKQLCALLKDPHYKLKTLTLYESGSITERDCTDLITALTVNPSHLRELDLNKNKLNKSGVQELCSLLKNPLCKLEKLKLVNAVTERHFSGLGSAFHTNPSYIRELDLSGNDLGELGMMELCSLLKNQHCKLQKLLLKECSIEEKGCADLTSALASNPSHLKELDLSGNRKLEYSVINLADLLQKSGCKLEFAHQ